VFDTLKVGLISAAIAAGAAWYIRGNIADGDIAAVRLELERGTAKAVKEAVDIAIRGAEFANRASGALANVSMNIEIAGSAILVEVPRYVTKDQACITYGFIRVLDAAAHGVDPATLNLPAGKSDGTCAPLEPAVVASKLVANITAAKLNAEQLDALSAVVRGPELAHPY
jgi:hypothetical protein